MPEENLLVVTLEYLRGGRIKPNDVIQAYYNSNRARFLVQQEMNKNISAANILGVDNNRLRKEFKDRQLSDATFRNLARGKFEPYFPSDDIQERFQRDCKKVLVILIYLEKLHLH
jgi:hypothetical protein